jgi:hypothetical protein
VSGGLKEKENRKKEEKRSKREKAKKRKVELLSAGVGIVGVEASEESQSCQKNPV